MLFVALLVYAFDSAPAGALLMLGFLLWLLRTDCALGSELGLRLLRLPILVCERTAAASVKKKSRPGNCPESKDGKSVRSIFQLTSVMLLLAFAGSRSWTAMLPLEEMRKIDKMMV